MFASFHVVVVVVVIIIRFQPRIFLFYYTTSVIRWVKAITFTTYFITYIYPSAVRLSSVVGKQTYQVAMYKLWITLGKAINCGSHLIYLYSLFFKELRAAHIAL